MINFIKFQKINSSLLILVMFLGLASNMFLLPIQKAEASDWYNIGGTWDYRKEITIDFDKVDMDLTDFAVLISVTDTDLADTDNNGHVVQSDGGDILFTNSDGHKLDHEIEKYTNTTGELVAWVEVDSLSSSANTVLYIYYGSSVVGNQWDMNATWESSLKMVQHLQEQVTDEGIVENVHIDSTSSDNHGDQHGNDDATAQIYKGQDFDGDDYVDCGTGNDGSFDFGTGDFTVGFWVKYASNLTRSLISTINADWTKGWAIETIVGTGIDFFTFEDPNDAIALSAQLYNDDMWHHVVGVRESNAVYLYVDSIQEVDNNSESTPLNVSNAGNVSIAYSEGDDYYANGSMDEVRIYNRALTANEISTQYNNQNSPSTFCSMGSQEAGNTAPNIPTLVSPSNSSYTSDNTPTLSANYSDPDAEDVGTTNYRISSSSLEDCVNNINIVTSGTSSQTTTNNETTEYTHSSSIGIDRTYYWCAQNNDGATTSAYTQMGSFILETTIPTISAFSPSDNAVNVALDANLIITFSESVDVETGNIVIKKTSDDSIVETIDIVSGQVSGTGTDTITINPSADLENNTEYYVQINTTCFDDIAGNSYAGITDTDTWSFTAIVAQTQAPESVDVSVEVSAGNISINLHNAVSLTTVTVPQSISPSVSLDITYGTPATVGGKKTITSKAQNLTITRDSISLKIPDSTTITDTDDTWNGNIILPTTQSNVSSDISLLSGQTIDTDLIVQIGLIDKKLTLDKAARILLPNQAGKRAGWNDGTNSQEITNTCDADTQAIGDALSSEGNCKIDVGSDLVIYTKHFTQFFSYTLTPTVGGGSFISPILPVISLSQNQTPTFEITIINDQSTINLSNVQNAYQIAISTTPDFKYVSWEPYQENINLPDVEKVYLKFRSPSGGVSEVYEVETKQISDITNPSIFNGSLIRAINDYKVYIINNNYKRHILDGEIFNFYGHLNWDNIQEVNSSQLNSYQESFLIRASNDYKVYEINNNKKHWLDITAEEFINSDRKWEMVYVVNEEERDFYKTEESE